MIGYQLLGRRRRAMDRDANSVTGSRLAPWLYCFLWISVSSGCGLAPVEQLPSTSPDAKIVGDTYRIVSDDVYAYGVYALDSKVVSSIELMPGVGIGGREVAFKRPIAKGQVLKIVSAWRSHELLFNTVYYVVASEAPNLPRDVEVRIRLDPDNVGADGGLNPRVYEKVTK
jgi:hypothetical protein